MKKSTIIGFVLCIIAFAVGIISMLTGKVSADTLVTLTGVSTFVILNYLVGKIFNRDNTPVRHSAVKYDRVQQYNGI